MCLLRKFFKHTLKLYDVRKPVQLKKRVMGAERSKVVMIEVHKLVEADILRPVSYQTWVANPVMVKNSDNTWRMCIDLKDLNNSCPKDCCLLPEIDGKVDALAGFRFGYQLKFFFSVFFFSHVVFFSGVATFLSTCIVSNGEVQVIMFSSCI